MRPSLSDRSGLRFLDDPFELDGRLPAGRAVTPPGVMKVRDPGGDLQPRLGAGGEGCRWTYSTLYEWKDSAAALSSADPTRPIDCTTPHLLHNCWNAAAPVVWKMTPST